MTTDQLKTELSQLPRDDRADLARYLIDSLDPNEDADARQAWDDELQRRLKEIRLGIAAGTPAQEVMARLREKHS